MMNKCKTCGTELEFLPGRPAHRSNIYCPKCDYPGYEEPAICSKPEPPGNRPTDITKLAQEILDNPEPFLSHALVEQALVLAQAVVDNDDKQNNRDFVDIKNHDNSVTRCYLLAED